MERGSRRRATGRASSLAGPWPEGPTLEIFNYNILKDKLDAAVNRPGFGHIAFAVDDVPSAREAVLAAGGRAVGRHRDAYDRDRIEGDVGVRHRSGEGNVIKLQSWAK